jgi:subtilase family serine protease
MAASAGAIFAQAGPNQGPPNQIPPGQALTVLVPDSSKEAPEDVGKRAHTNHVIALRGGQTLAVPSGYSPANIRDAYGLPVSLTKGGGGVIAIVDAYDYPTAENDLNVFSAKFGLPACPTGNGCLQIVYASGSKPAGNCGWAQEAALDIEWAHAMAPQAAIVLVEAASSSFSDLFKAVDVARQIVVSSGGKGQVSMSWGGSEFGGETGYDYLFSAPSGVVFFAASGDSGGKTIYPSASPNVVSAGGTTLVKSGSSWIETGWSGSGGGPSKFESRPSYQDAIATIVGRMRGTPDFSFDADPSTGVSVYDSTSCGGLTGWMVFGGTSVSTPSLAGIVNLTGSVSSNSALELSLIYSGLGKVNFRDITSGRAGKYNAAKGWDFVTGVGSDLGTSGK